jgi:HlyD family secretion protein
MTFVKSVTAALAFLLVGCGERGEKAIEASGTIEGTDVNIGAQVSGKVTDVRVSEGALVSTGDTLVLVDDLEYRLQLRQAVANGEASEAQYRLALEGSRKEDIIQAEANLRTAETDYNRMKELLPSQTVTQRQYDEAYARFVSAQQTFDKLTRGSRQEEIRAARARRDQALAQADLLRKKLEDCHILAPSGGTITLRGIEPGELVAPGMNLLRLTKLDRVKLTLYLNEKDVGRIKIGQRARVTIDADPAKAYDGTVVYVSPAAEFTPKNVQTTEERTKLVFAVRLEVDNADGGLKPGLPADAKLLVNE